MVQKYQSPVRVYKYPFEMVMAAYEKRFPTCHMIPVFVGSEVISETVSPDGATQVVERRCCLDVDAPFLLKRLVGFDYIYFNQKNSLDRRNRTLSIEAHNESFSTRILIYEHCQYSVHPENPNWTCFEQDASLDVKSFMGFETTIEKIAMKQYTLNIKKGKEVIEYYINELISEGTTYIEPWSEGTPLAPRLWNPSSDACDNASDDDCFESASADIPSTSYENPLDATSKDSASVFATSLGVDELDDEVLELQGVVGRHRMSSHKGGHQRGKMGGSGRSGGSKSLAPGMTEHGGGGMWKGAGGGEKQVAADKRRTLSSGSSGGGMEGGLGNIPVEGEGKLDADYIQRCLGELTPYEESKLVQMRRWLQDTHKDKIPKDSHILRFLRARDFNIEKGREMLCHSLAWRKLHGIDRLLTTYTPSPAIQKYYPGGWHYYDKEGRPLYILRLGQMDVKGLAKAVGYESILKHVLAVNEEGLKRCEDATIKLGRPVNNWTCIVDLEGLSMRHLWRPGVRAFLRIVEVVEANYPETMAYLLIVRAPRVFPVLWTLISPFIDERTREKFLIYSGKDCLGPGGLIDFVDMKYIPDFLNGDCYCAAPEGGIVPKTLYKSTSEEDLGDKEKVTVTDDTKFSVENIYHTAYVVKDFSHEVLVQVPKRGCVITWDFDILKGDVTFTILRCRRPLSSPPHAHHMSGAAGGVGSVQYVDRRSTVGLDLTMVEAPIVCRDGDSMQGSHVASQAGSYILQWKYFDLGKVSFDLLSTHKSKVMYYTELLLSEHFKGSMSSLQSSHSGFSQLSLSVNNGNSSGSGASGHVHSHLTVLQSMGSGSGAEGVAGGEG